MVNIIKLKEIGSTNSYALENIDSLKNKDVVIAKKQTAGKGRLGRKWVSDDSSNIHMSIILKPDNSSYPYCNITQYLSVVVCRVLEKYGIKASIKWPNDILIEGSKIAGILCEAKNKNSQIAALVLGLGLNVNLGASVLNSIDQKAISLKMLLGKEIDSYELSNEIVDEFFNYYDDFISQGFEFIKGEYVERCDFLGKKIKILSLKSKQEVIAKSISNAGELVVLDLEGDEKLILSGDITYF